jgi:hypothetical protein
MTSRCKVWCALGVALLVNLFATAESHAQTTYTVELDGAHFTPASLPNLTAGDSVLLKFRDDYHTVYLDGVLLLGRAQFRNEQHLQTFSSDGTFVYNDTRYNTTLTVKVIQPVNAAPTVNITNLALRLAIKAGSNVVLRASADDEDGSIRRVVFQYGLGTNLAALTNIIGTSTASPYNITWTNPAAGRYLVRAQAYDNLEVFANSPRINLSLYTPFTNTLPAVTNVSGVSNLVFRFNTDTGLVYAVEVSTNLTNWSAITTNTATNSAIEVLDPNLSALSNRFYRIRLIP